MNRTIDDHGCNLVVRTYRDLAVPVKLYYENMAWRRRHAGENVPSGELKGPSHALNRVLCWLMTLTDQDQQRIQREGGELFERLHRLPPGHDGPLGFERRNATVFRGES